MSFTCECGCDSFTVDYGEALTGTALVDGDGDILSTFNEERTSLEYIGEYVCDDCGKEFDTLHPELEKDPEEKWRKEKEDYYIRTGGTNCPFCGESDAIEGGHVEIDAGGANQYCTCGNCDSEWCDMYRLDHINVESYPTDLMLEEVFPEGKKPDPNKEFKKS